MNQLDSCVGEGLEDVGNLSQRNANDGEHAHEDANLGLGHAAVLAGPRVTKVLPQLAKSTDLQFGRAPTVAERFLPMRWAAKLCAPAAIQARTIESLVAYLAEAVRVDVLTRGQVPISCASRRHAQKSHALAELVGDLVEDRP